MSEPESSPLPDQPGNRRRRSSEDVPMGSARAAGPLDHPVVAGYDGSVSSRHALAYAAGLSRRLGRPLLVVHVSPPAVYCEPFAAQAPLLSESTEAEGWILAELDEVCDCADLTVAVVTRHGSPARELAAAADTHGADALVIGAPGCRWHQFAGSVSSWLARHAHCPVVVVP